MNSLRKKEIRQKAKEVETVAERYQLIHATYACQSIIRDSITAHFKTHYDELKRKIEEKANRGMNFDEEEKEKKELEEKLKNNGFHIAFRISSCHIERKQSKKISSWLAPIRANGNSAGFSFACFRQNFSCGRG